MSKKGFRRGKKRLLLQRVRGIGKKMFKWVLGSVPGPHSKKSSLPLGVFLRDILRLSKNIKETKYILNKGIVKIDGVVRKELRFPLGFQDVLTVGDKTYRVLFDKKMNFNLEEIKKEKNTKLVKIKGKKHVGKGKIQLTLGDGRTVLVEKKEKDKFKIDDVLKIEIPKTKILEHYALKKGAKALVLSKKVLEGEIQEIVPGDKYKKSIVKLRDKNKKTFETIKEKVFVIG